MNKKILINFASRSRPERALKAIANTQEHIQNGNFKIFLKVDSDDTKVLKYPVLMPLIGWTYVGVSKDKISAINRNITEITAVYDWDILINMSDDIVWTATGFDNIIREHCGPDDFVLFPEPYADGQVVKGKNDRISVVSIMGRKYYERDSYVYHPSYKRTHCDNEATQVARERGCLKEVEIPIFYHEHPAAGYPVNDEQYKLERDTWAYDSDNYKKRKEAGWPK